MKMKSLGCFFLIVTKLTLLQLMLLLLLNGHHGHATRARIDLLPSASTACYDPHGDLPLRLPDKAAGRMLMGVDIVGGRGGGDGGGRRSRCLLGMRSFTTPAPRAPMPNQLRPRGAPPGVPITGKKLGDHPPYPPPPDVRA